MVSEWGHGLRAQRVLMVAMASVLVLSACDWSQFRGDAAHSGYQPFESKIGPSNVSTLTEAWTAATGGAVFSSPAVANGVAYVGSADGKFSAFDAAGVTNCSGAPTHCAPLWTATTGADVHSSPAVAKGIVYVGSTDGKLYAFDAAGVTNCSGAPRTCTPLWTARLSGPSSPTVAGGVVYAGSLDGKLYAFDAAGLTNCSGVPKTCTPLWTAAVGTFVQSSPAVANGVVYIGSGDLYAFDAAGVTNCTGTPKTCTPLWIDTAAIGTSSPAVVNGVAYVGSTDGTFSAFDAAGVTNCIGTPKRCAPLWTATAGSLVQSSPAVANGVVYIGSGDLYAFDAAGLANCTGSPKRCVPLWTGKAAIGSSSPTVANGVVYVGSTDGTVSAFDAAGTANCTGSPKSCSAVWTATAGNAVDSSPAVANGVVYLGSNDFKLYAYRPCVNPETSVGLAPCDIQNAYRLPSYVGGTGKTVAIVDAYHDPNAESDLAVYRSTFGLAPCTTANGCFRQVNQQGISNRPPSSDVGWSVEISLDLNMVSASCPNCKILLVEATTPSIADLGAAEDTAVVLGASVVSNSYGANEVAGLSAFDSHFVHAGVPIVVASGDGGYAAGPQWPAVIPTVTTVGGTTLTHTGTGRGWSESVWNDAAPGAIAGSGCSNYEAKPAWQHDPTCAKRTDADIAAVAKNLAIYDTYGAPGWFTVGGTSAAAPIIAGTYALGGGTTGVSALYASPTRFFDVTVGNNGACGGSYLCTAGPGYDGPTGLGTPCGAGAFGNAFLPQAGCGGAASSGPPPLAPAVSRPALDSVPACRTAPPGYARCAAYYRFGDATPAGK